MKHHQNIECLKMVAQRMLPIMLFCILTTTVYAQQNLVQYDHDIYAEVESEDGFEYPVKYFLKVGEQMIRLEEEESGDSYKIEIEKKKYYVTGLDGKRYLLSFKPQEIICMEKDEAYETKCAKIAKDYKKHPEKYEDVTVVTDNLVHSYTDKSGFEWIYETEGGGFHVLEDEGVYMIFDELKFIRKKESDKVSIEMVEEAPEFPGGNAKLMEFLYSNIKYPTAAKENGIQGRVIVKFVVDTDGSIVEPEVIRSLDPSCDKEAIRVINAMPKWKPGKKDGKLVRVEFKMPINFRLSQ